MISLKLDDFVLLLLLDLFVLLEFFIPLLFLLVVDFLQLLYYVVDMVVKVVEGPLIDMGGK